MAPSTTCIANPSLYFVFCSLKLTERAEGKERIGGQMKLFQKKIGLASESDVIVKLDEVCKLLQIPTNSPPVIVSESNLERTVLSISYTLSKRNQEWQGGKLRELLNFIEQTANVCIDKGWNEFRKVLLRIKRKYCLS